MAAVLAENYQLKWHSHSSHLHSSVATLYRSDNFTDVTLVTSDGRYLAAHRFVLSSCSSYLNRVLHLGAVNGAHFSSTPLIVVLPSEISYRTMAILLQYMYSGEATVSNDQLNGVLRAGELLRIRGLCHTGVKEKEKRYFSSNTSTHSDSHSRAGSSNSGRLSANNYYQGTQQGQTSGRLKTPDVCNPSSSTVPSKISKTKPIVQKGTDEGTVQRASSADKNKEKRHQVKDKDPKENSLEVSSSGEGSEIVIEDNMKIELLVKEEPIDWDEEDDIGPEDEDPVATVKAERYSPGDCGDNVYAPLTCDMCQETFTSPALWVRHIETHPVTEIPTKKRKRSQGDDDNEDEDEFQLLRCELCQKMYTSPADWVRHIQSAHTEEQLAVSNNTRRLRKSTLVSCPSCNKTFPSLASMLIHSRTHTGEKPYVCCICEKGFNVKSNLLRHLRTLHDHLISPENQFQSVMKDSS